MSEPDNKDDAESPISMGALEMARMFWAGLDVGVETTSVCVIDDNGEILHEAVCPTKVKDVHQEIRFLKRRRHANVGIEAGVGTALARGLRSLGYSVNIYEARQLSKFLRVRRNKSDAGDAVGIAQAGRLGSTIVSKVYLKSLDDQSLASRLTIRRHLIRARVRMASLLCRQVEGFGGRIRSSKRFSGMRERADAQIKEIFGNSSNPVVTELRALLAQCEELTRQQIRMDRDLMRFAKEDDVCRRLMTIPGVGPICALTFRATIGEPGRFAKTEGVGSYLGLTPRFRQSGLMFRMGRVSKMGHRATRTLLVQASIHFMRWSRTDAELHAWASRIQERRGRGRARVALARKLAIIMITMWKRGQNYQPRLVAA